MATNDPRPYSPNQPDVISSTPTANNNSNPSNYSNFTFGSSVAPAELQLSHAFGINSKLSNSISFMEENVILYPAGRALVLYHLENKTQRFIHGSINPLGPKTSASGEVMKTNLKLCITAIAVSLDKKFIAVAEKGDACIISVFDTRTLHCRKVLRSPKERMNGKEFVALAFSPNGKQLISLGGECGHCRLLPTED